MKAMFALLALALASGCASQKASVLNMNSMELKSSDRGQIEGLESRAAPPDEFGVRDVNIVFFHGMGWTQKESTLAKEFIKGLARHYGDGNLSTQEEDLCSADGGVLIRLSNDQGIGKLQYSTDLRSSILTVDEIGCMDQRSYTTSAGIRYNVYRLFWDDYIWEALQGPHVGYDDDVFRKTDPPNERVGESRKKFNKDYKDTILNYGLTDVAVYLSPAGDLIRKAVRTSICLAAGDSAGQRLEERGSGARSQSDKARVVILDKDNICEQSIRVENAASFAFASESFGSRVLFDVLRAEMRNEKTTAIDQILNQSPEIYMLGNQVPLLGLGQLAEYDRSAETNVALNARTSLPKIVVLSELNDILTYEIVPYLEYLWMRGQADRTHQDLNKPEIRDSIAREFGFEVVDLRLRFAPPFLGVIGNFLGIADTAHAHTRHAEKPRIMKMLVCGNRTSEAGEPRDC
ncbi:MAG: hypothetical protein ABJH52_14465 [Henriciella sp.]